MSNWRKGCLCGCLIEEECRYYRAPAKRIEHVHIHHVVIHHEAELEPPRTWVDAVEIVNEIEDDGGVAPL